jgi:uncharacterized repeat protein (TIGR03803 family)
MQPPKWISGLPPRVMRGALALAVVLLAAIVAIRPAQAQTFTLLYQFTGGVTGGNPVTGLVLDAAGNLYGTTSFGGVVGGTCKPLQGCGGVFKLDTSGKESVLYSFTGLADGEAPSGDLILDGVGNLYGTTSGGGAIGGTCSRTQGCGVVFKLDTSGSNYTVLYSFTGGADGAGPPGSLVLDALGNLYGTTQGGGNPACSGGCGTVFKLDAAGTETVLYSFTGQADGAHPSGGLVQDAAGNFYGTAAGIVFKLDTANTETVLHTFTGGADGGNPNPGLVLDPAGNLYGTASSGGALNCLGGRRDKVGCGLVFKLDPAGVETEYNFTVGGNTPVAGLVRDTAGNLYGTTEFTGSRAGLGGIVFEMNPNANGAQTKLFDWGQDRPYPVARLVLDASGNLYGTTEFGGFYGAGTVFKINPTGPQNFAFTVAPAGNGSGTVTGNPGIDCPSSCQTFLTPGTAVTLTATAAAGSSFSGWNGPSSCPGTGPCSLTTTNSAQVVFATFILDFSLSASVLTPGTVSPGTSSTSTLTVSAGNSFNGAVALTCSVTPSPALGPTCSISPSSVNPGTPATLTVGTTGPTAAALLPRSGFGLFYAVWLPLIGLVATRVGLSSGQKRKGKISAVVLACMLFSGLVFQAACGGGNTSTGGGSSGTPAGTYTITVTGTGAAGVLVHSIPTILKVQ